jgi:sugar lactone lactonase YvrE
LTLEVVVTVKIVAETRNVLGESPAWAALEQALYWVDIPAKRLYRWNQLLEEQSCELPELVSAVVPRALGGVVLTLEKRVAVFDPVTGSLETLCRPDPHPQNRSNDARCDALGRLWLGTMQNNFDANGQGQEITQHSGALYKIESNGNSLEMLNNIGISNGLAWSPDSKIMYFADSMTNQIDAFDFDLERGFISNQRHFSNLERGVPDGSCTDSEGFLWNARWGGSCLVRFDSNGTVDRVIELPVTQPSSCTFGGEHLEILFVTSARTGLNEPNSLDGALLALDVGVRGFSSPTFAG